MQRRISFFLTEHHNNMLNDLIKDPRIKTQAKVIRRGIELYKQIYEVVKNGGTVEVTDINGKKTNIVP